MIQIAIIVTAPPAWAIRSTDACEARSAPCSQIRWGVVAKNLLLQVLVVYLMMVWRVGRIVLQCIANKIAFLFDFSKKAAWVLFSDTLPHMLSIEVSKHFRGKKMTYLMVTTGAHRTAQSKCENEDFTGYYYEWSAGRGTKLFRE